MSPRDPHPALVVASVAVVLAVTACGRTGGDPDVDEQEATVEVGSPDLADQGTVPVQFTCDGADSMPAIAWTNLPDDTVEVAIVVDDPDAPNGTFTHWTAWGIDPGDTPLAEDLPRPTVQGTNDFGSVGWRGPCPPPGDDPHRYRFRVFALDAPLRLDEGASPDEVASAMDGHVLGEGLLTATYARG